MTDLEIILKAVFRFFVSIIFIVMMFVEGSRPVTTIDIYLVGFLLALLLTVRR